MQHPHFARIADLHVLTHSASEHVSVCRHSSGDRGPAAAPPVRFGHYWLDDPARFVIAAGAGE
jgi:hypothetical protein